jgi:hypothetical protein
MCLELEEARGGLFDLVGKFHAERGIPFYLIESITNDVAREVSSCAKAEREAALRLYEEKCKGGGGND